MVSPAQVKEGFTGAQLDAPYWEGMVLGENTQHIENPIVTEMSVLDLLEKIPSWVKKFLSKVRSEQ